MSRTLLALPLALAFLGGCATRPPAAAPRAADLEVGGARFRVVWSPGDERGARQVIQALEAAAPRGGRWGALARPVTITVHPHHAALEAAARRKGCRFLRAWARYDTIEIQSPGTWGLLGASRRRLEELLTHELTHCAMYQHAGDEHSWMYKEIPRWFSEGLATLAAEQGYRFPGAEALWRFYGARLSPAETGESGSGGASPSRPAAFHGDPIGDSYPICQDESEMVYGAAHLAAEFLVRRYGEERVRRILALMGGGLRFPAAFREAIGIGDAEFAADFRRYVVWEGWR